MDPAVSVAEIERAVEVLRAGGLVAFPTETVYGLGADASHTDAVNRIFTVKGRPADHPLIVHIGDPTDLDEWAVDVPEIAYRFAREFWPGPLTLILRRSERVVDAVTGGRDTVGVRVPAHPVALEMLRRFGGGVAAPSANRFGRVSPTTAEHVRVDLGGDVDFVLDGGPCTVGVESTIVDLSVAEPEVLRPGGVGIERLSTVAGHPIGRWTGGREVTAPGTLPSHYAPEVSVEVVGHDEIAARTTALVGAGLRVGILAPDVVSDLCDDVVCLAPAGDPQNYARVLYQRLREADASSLDVLLVVPPEPTGIGAAVRDRLVRAAGKVRRNT